MYEFNAATLLLSFLITWGIGLLPPVLVRFVFLKRPIGKWPAMGICGLFWFLNLILFSILGSQSKTHSALILVAFFSYWILRKEIKLVGSEQNQPSKEKENVCRLSPSSSYVPVVPVATNLPGTVPTRVNTNYQAIVAKTSDQIQEASMDDFEDRVYAEIAKELEDGVADKGLWTRLFAECGGDEKQTKVFYIKQRAEKLISIERARLEQEASKRAAEVARIEAAKLEQLRGTADAKLATAIGDGNWALASMLLREGVKPDGFDETGNSLLDLARKRNDRQLILLLESYGAGQV